MADSDEEHERSRSRDKFRKERNDYGDKSRSRGDYRDRRSWRDDREGGRRRGRDDYEEDRERRRHSSPGRGRDWSPPPHKRMRREAWEGFHGFPPDMMGPYGMRGPWMPPDIRGSMHHMPPRPGLHGESMASPTLEPKKQAMLSFKQFLSQQDDSIDESKAINLYQEYKNEFKRKRIIQFFDEHKEEDWLICKYHPKQILARNEAHTISLQSRQKAFLFLYQTGQLDGVPLFAECSDDIIRTMDSAVIMMEGGTEHDLLSLQEHTEPVEEENERKKVKEVIEKDKVGETKEEKEESLSKDKPFFMMVEPTEEQRQLAQQARAYGQQMQALTGAEAEQARKYKKKQQQTTGDQYSYSGDKSDGTSGESDVEEDQPEADEEPPPPGLESPPHKLEKEVGEMKGESSEAQPETGQTETIVGSSENNDDMGSPCPLHITRSVYIRHIPPKVAAEDIVEICKTIPGYLRIAFADPDPNRGYERRGWVTYSHDTDIREVTARLTANKVKTVQLNCMVNRELTRRVKVGPESTWASRAVHKDIHLLLRLVTALDKKTGLWDNGEEENGKPNPVLAIPEYILSEESLTTSVGEEEEGVVSDPGTEIMNENDAKVKALDRLIWYLRIVHSVDYYNTMVFPTEDCMPHRCGIFTIRPQKPKAATQDEVNSYASSMESKIIPMLETKLDVSEKDMEKFGKKDPDSEAEHFIEMNTQKLAENKYLCPLSGKKFKGPDFVRKHILNKHIERVEAIKQEAELFNNYLRDPDRPVAVEAVTSVPVMCISTSGDEVPTTPGGTPGGWGQGPQMMFRRGGFPPTFPPGLMSRGFRSRGSHRGRNRKIINYHDLDTPEEMY